MAKPHATVHDLARIGCDGERFYRAIAGRLRSPQLCESVAELGRQRHELHREITALLSHYGERVCGFGTLYGTMRQFCSGLRARLSRDSDHVHIVEAEHVEDRLLHALERATLHPQSAELLAILRRHMPSVRAAHERMQALKGEWPNRL